MSDPTHRPPTILMADDDEEDRQLTREALQNPQLARGMRFVGDGRELLDYLRREGAYRDVQAAPRPEIILLDLNMPRMDGREALAEMKADLDLRSIPVVVMTTSRADEDVSRTYGLGANSFITKPASFAGLVDVMATWQRYWFGLSELPRA